MAPLFKVCINCIKSYHKDFTVLDLLHNFPVIQQHLRRKQTKSSKPKLPPGANVQDVPIAWKLPIYKETFYKSGIGEMYPSLQ